MGAPIHHSRCYSITQCQNRHLASGNSSLDLYGPLITNYEDDLWANKRDGLARLRDESGEGSVWIWRKDLCQNVFLEPKYGQMTRLGAKTEIYYDIVFLPIQYQNHTKQEN